MFEGLDKINWPQLSHTYGAASNVPDLLQKIVEEDKNNLAETPDSQGLQIRAKTSHYPALVFQSWSWFQFTAQLHTEITNTPVPCRPATTLALRGTGLDGYSITPFSLLTQGRSPHTIFPYNVTCAQTIQPSGVRVADFMGNGYDEQPWGTGWFDLHTLHP